MKTMIVAIICLLAVPVLAVEYDGEFNPDDLMTKWEMIMVYPCSAGHIHAIVQNPDPKHPVQEVELILTQSYGLLGYTYTKDETTYTFIYKLNINKFIQIKPVKPTSI